MVSALVTTQPVGEQFAFPVSTGGTGLGVIVADVAAGNATAATVPAWFVNAASGSDTNTGQSAATAFQTAEKLSQVLCPGGQRVLLRQNTNIFFAPGAYGKLELAIDWPSGTPLFSIGLQIFGAFTQTIVVVGAVHVTTAPAAAGGVRAEVNTAAGAFVAKSRMTSPPCVVGNDVPGLLTYSTGLNGSALDTFTGNWMDIFGHAANTPGAGSQIGIDVVNVTIATLNLDCNGTGFSYVQDVNATGGNMRSDYVASADDYVLQLFGCGIEGTFNNTQADFLGCRTTAAATFVGGSPRFFGCAWQNAVTFEFSCYAQFRSANYADGGSMLIQKAAQVLSVNFFEWCNGAGSAWTLNPGTFLNVQGLLWGAVSTPYAVGVTQQSGTGVIGTGASLASNFAIPATNQFSTCGQLTAVAPVTGFAFARAGCFVALDPDPTATKTVA